MNLLREEGLGLAFGPICLGTMPFGTRCSARDSLCMLDDYFGNGGQFFDTANSYAHWLGNGTGGESETILGKWIASRRVQGKVCIATKVGFPYPGCEGGLAAKTIIAECDKSLRRLHVDTIDVYYAHIDDRTLGLEEILETFSRLIRDGKVRYLGASNYETWRVADSLCVSNAKGLPQFRFLQQRFSYLRPTPGARFFPQVVATDETIDFCRDRGIRLLAYSPLLGGAYGDSDRRFPWQYVGADSTCRLGVLERKAEDLGCTLNQLVLAWLINRSPAIVPVIGVSSTAQLRECMKATNVALTDLEVDSLSLACTSGTAW